MKHLHLLTSFFIVMFFIAGCEKTPAPPEISGINPTTGGYGTQVVITGKNFAAQATGNIVTINGIEVEVVNAGETSLTVIVPTLAEGEWPVKVKTEIGETSAGMFNYHWTIYVAGNEFNSSGSNVAKYWKNGTPVNLSDGQSRAWAYSIAVSGTDVYIVGDDGYGARCWKNGVALQVECNQAFTTFNSVYIAGDDVFIAGSERSDELSPAHAYYWRNGTRVSLTDNTRLSVASAIFVR